MENKINEEVKNQNEKSNYEKAQLVWEFINSLDFDCDVTMERVDDGYEIFIECDNNKKNID